MRKMILSGNDLLAYNIIKYKFNILWYDFCFFFIIIKAIFREKLNFIFL